MEKKRYTKFRDKLERAIVQKVHGAVYNLKWIDNCSAVGTDGMEWTKYGNVMTINAEIKRNLKI